MKIRLRRTYEPGHSVGLRPSEMFLNVPDRILYYAEADGTQHRLNLEGVPDSFLRLLGEDGFEVYTNQLQQEAPDDSPT